MKQLYLRILALMSFILFIAGCNIFKYSKRTTVTKTEHVSQQLPQGTFETNTVTTTQTVSDANPKVDKKFVSTNCDEAPQEYHWTIVNEKVYKGDKIITISADTTSIKEITTYDVKQIAQSRKVERNVKAKIYLNNTESEPKSDCHSEVVKITAKSSTFMNADYEAQGQYIYPGAIYDYNNFIKGRYIEIKEPRNPIKLMTDNPNISVPTWTIIQSPEKTTIRDGIASIYNRFDNRQIGTMNLRYQTFESTTEAEYSLRLAAGASFSSFSLEGEFKNTNKSNENFVTIDAIKPLYTISCEQACSPNYFKNVLPESIAKNPVIISSVTYGVRVLANFKLRTNNEEQLLAFKAKYNGIGTKAHVDFDYLTKHADIDQTINCYVVGGPGYSTVSFNKNDFEKNLKAIVGGVTYATARPISYELRDLNGRIISLKSATDEITIEKCYPHFIEPILKNIIVIINNGKDGKDANTDYTIFMRNGYHDDLNSIDGYNCFSFREIDQIYKSNDEVIFEMNLPAKKLTLDDFSNSKTNTIVINSTRHGGNGNDDWDINHVTFILEFDGIENKKVEFSNFTLTKDVPKKKLLFNNNFQKY